MGYSARSKGDGSFSFGNDTPDLPGSLTAWRQDVTHCHVLVREDVRPSRGPVELLIVDDLIISGRLDPVPGKDGPWYLQFQNGAFEVPIRVGEGGHFQIRGVPTDGWTLTADHKQKQVIHHVVDPGSKDVILAWKR